MLTFKLLSNKFYKFSKENVMEPTTNDQATVNTAANLENDAKLALAKATRPVESAFEHAESTIENTAATLGAKVASPIHSAHVELIERQKALHEQVVMLAHRLEDVLKIPFGGLKESEGVQQHGSSPVAQNLSTSSSITSDTTAVVNHLLNNLEV